MGHAYIQTLTHASWKELIRTFAAELLTCPRIRYFRLPKLHSPRYWGFARRLTSPCKRSPSLQRALPFSGTKPLFHGCYQDTLGTGLSETPPGRGHHSSRAAPLKDAEKENEAELQSLTGPEQPTVHSRKVVCSLDQSPGQLGKAPQQHQIRASENHLPSFVLCCMPPSCTPSTSHVALPPVL